MCNARGLGKNVALAKAWFWQEHDFGKKMSIW
jgi:hypothetical protein